MTLFRKFLSRNIYRALAVCALTSVFTAASIPAFAVDAPQEEMTEKLLGKSDRKKAAEAISADYHPWSKAAMSGKLRCDALPVSPSLRVSMLKDQQLFLSVRAPFVGEALRVELTPEKLLIVNKMKKTYTQLEFDADMPLMEYAQSLLLGRVVIVGDGELSKSNCKNTEIYSLGNGDEESNGWAIVPTNLPDGISYAYTVDPEARITGLMIYVNENKVNKLLGKDGKMDVTAEGELVPLVEIDIAYNNSGKATADIKTSFDKFHLEAEIEFDAPEYGAKLIEPIELTSRYKEVRPQEVIKF